MENKESVDIMDQLGFHLHLMLREKDFVQQVHSLHLQNMERAQYLVQYNFQGNQW